MTVSLGSSRRRRPSHSIKLMCRVLGVSRSGFPRLASARTGGARALEDQPLLDRPHPGDPRANRGVYGSPRIHAELGLGHGMRVGRKRVERLMREAGITGMVPRKPGARRPASRASGPPMISSSATSPPAARTGSGSPTSPTCGAGRAGLLRARPWTPSRAGSSAGSMADHMRTELVARRAADGARAPPARRRRRAHPPLRSRQPTRTQGVVATPGYR